MTQVEAIAKLRAIAEFLRVSEETLEDAWDDPEWTWQEQQELSDKLSAIADALAPER